MTTPYTANSVNRYTTIDGLTAPLHDADGNTTRVQFPPVASGSASAVWTYSYDAQNRLIGGSSTSGDSFTFANDARNRCVARTISLAGATPTTTTTANLYDGWSLIEERDSSDTPVACHIHGAVLDEVLCSIRSISGGGSTTSYPHYDGLGSTTALTDGTGALVERISYDLYGTPTITAPSGTVLATSSVGNRFLFTGREYFASLQLADHRNRYYAPASGRWLSRDPIEERGGINLYGYVGNGPTMRVDPLGLLELNPADNATEAHLLFNWEVLGVPPSGPPGSSARDNITSASKHCFDPDWFYNQVKNKGPWDYKQSDKTNYEYKVFGNFNYGAAGSAMFIPPEILRRMAGWAQRQAGTSCPEWGDPGKFIGRYPVPGTGTPPYGDDPKDQYWINVGMQYYNRLKHRGR